MLKKISLLLVVLIVIQTNVGAIQARDTVLRPEMSYFDIYTRTEKVIPAKIMRCIPFSWRLGPASGNTEIGFVKDTSKTSFEDIKNSVSISYQCEPEIDNLRFFAIKDGRLTNEINTVEEVFKAEMILCSTLSRGEKSPKSDSSLGSWRQPFLETHEIRRIENDERNKAELAKAERDYEEPKRSGPRRGPRRDAEIAATIARGDQIRAERIAKRAAGGGGSPLSSSKEKS